MLIGASAANETAFVAVQNLGGIIPPAGLILADLVALRNLPTDVFYYVFFLILCYQSLVQNQGKMPMRGHRVISPAGRKSLEASGLPLGNDKECREKSKQALRELWADPVFKDKQLKNRAKKNYPPPPTCLIT